MQYKTVFVCMLNIKFIHFNSLFKASYIKQKHLTEFLYLIQQRYYRERREKVGNMSSFNRWLIFVTLLFNFFFYQSAFTGYYSSNPPSGELLHQAPQLFKSWIALLREPIVLREPIAISTG